MKTNCLKREHSQGGFTLVELVVVIAILAILAAVGAVAYTGYIEYAHKGVDKKTVGEIMNAVELADYADPTLFGENGGAMIVLTKDGVKAAGGLKGSNLTGALTDTFGDLDTVTLSYDKWSGKVDGTILTQLAEIDSIKAYFTEADSSGKKASYSDNIEDMWETVKNVTSGIVGTDGDYIAQTVEAYGHLNETGKENIKNQWATQITESGAKSQAIIAARNYSFYSYALQQSDCTDTMRAELENWKTNNSGMDFIIMSFDGASAKSNYLKDSSWDTIATRYKSEQAAIDAIAFFGILDAADLAGEDLEKTSEGGRPTDEAYRDAMSAYTGMVSNVLSGRVKLQDISTLASNIGDNAIIVNVTKANGALSFSVSPEDANPRGESGNDAPQEEVDYTQSGDTLDFSDGRGTSSVKGEIFVKPNETINITVANLSDSTSITDFSCTYSGDGVTSASGTKGSKSVSITSGGSGTTGTVVISWKPLIGSSSFTVTITVNVK